METEETHESMISASHEHESSKMPQYLATLAVTMAVFSAGTTIGWSSPALAEMRSPNATLHLTSEQGSWVGSLVAIGAAVGAIPAGSLVEHIGRKWTIMGMSVPLMTSWVMIHYSTSVGTIYLARLLAGVGLGAACATVPIYIVEIAEDSIRGTLGSTFQLMTVIGVLYTYIVGALVPYTLLPIFCGAVNIIFIILFFKAPESPVFLLKKDRRRQAEEALRCLRGKKYNIYKELHAMEKQISIQSVEKVPFFQELSKKSSLYSLAMCLGLMSFQQLSGINIVVFYTESIFHDAGSSLDPAVSTILAGIAQMFATLSSAALIDRSGRRILLQMSSSVMGVCLAVLGYYFHLKAKGSDVTELGSIPIIAVIVYIIMYGAGFGPIPWLMSGELMPPEIKGPGLGIAASYKWFLAFAVTKSFHPLTDAVGPAVTYWIFAAICVIAFLFSTFVVIETKGKSLTQLQEELTGTKKSSTKKKTNFLI